MLTPLDKLTALLGPARVLSGADVSEDDWHDESLVAQWHAPDVVVLPHSAAEVAEIVTIAREFGMPVTARGSGTGLAGACVPREGGILIAFREMGAILEIDVENQVAVVQPGVSLRDLDEATAGHGLVYPVFPGESSASLGGTVATNAGGMRAVKYGVTRHQVLGLEAVLGTGEVIRTGGKFVKSTSGYDLTQLIVGSEGNARDHHRGGPAPVSAPSARGHRARALQDGGRDRQGGASHRPEWRGADDPRVHRHDVDGCHHRGARAGAGDRRRRQGRRSRLPRRRPRVAGRGAARRGHRGAR